MTEPQRPTPVVHGAASDEEVAAVHAAVHQALAAAASREGFLGGWRRRRLAALARTEPDARSPR